MEGGPRKHAAVKGRHSSSPYMTRIGSNANNPWDNSSPRTSPSRVTAPTIVMYTLVKGRIALYFENVSETALFFSSLCACTFFLPVAVFVDFLVELLL